MLLFFLRSAVLFITVSVGATLLSETAPFAGEKQISYRAAVVTFRPILGDAAQNLAEIRKLVQTALKSGAKVVVLPEQATTGFGITREQAPGLALAAPFSELEPLKRDAKRYRAAIAFGIVEKDGRSGKIYNSAVLIQPNGKLAIQRKRLASSESFGWNARGDTPIEVYDTPYGKLAVLICADTFLMDWVRIAALKGAQAVLVPANWWGTNDQSELWKARAKENGVWIIAANRWGDERNVYPPPADLYMSDGPSAVVDPDGNVRSYFEANDRLAMSNTITYSDIVIRPQRPPENFTVINRRATSYNALANDNYVPGKNSAPTDLPAPGLQPVELLAYQPDQNADTNLATVRNLVQGKKYKDAVMLLPGLGLVTEPLAATKIDHVGGDDYWKQVRSLVSATEAAALVTSVLVHDGRTGSYLAVAVISATGMEFLPQIHDSGKFVGSGAPLKLLTLKYGLAAVVTGSDSLFPEIGVQAAKNGADILLVTSEIGGLGSPAFESSGLQRNIPSTWSWDALVDHWKITANGCLHVAATDAGGLSFTAIQGDYCAPKQSVISHFTSSQILLDTGSQRKKLLNWYYPFDLRTLLQ